MKVVAAITLAYLAQSAPTKVAKRELQFTEEDNLPFFYPTSEFETFTPSPSFTEVSDEQSEQVGKNALLEKLGLQEDELRITRIAKDADGVLHMYAVHIVNGVEVDNHNAAVHVKNGEVVAQSASFSQSGSNFVPPNVAPVETPVSLDEAVAAATSQLGAPRDDFPASNAYLQMADGDLVYTHKFQLRDDEAGKWYEVQVDASNGQVVSVTNFYNSASYDVIVPPKVIPTQGFEVVTDPADKTASPDGWHKAGSTSYTDTRGNNVDSRIGSYRADGGSSLKFDTNWEESEDPTTAENKRASVVNNFYVSNLFHDITYHFGFDEASGNFQEDNFGRGGRGSDSVNINNQARGSNNANFATPPDGQNPTMNMYLWTTVSPRRDGSLDNGVPLHEYGHGVSNRLTGGASASSCLRTAESGGMGEGWSDTFAWLLERKEGEDRTTQTTLGAYVYNNPRGIRTHPYSTDLSVNPLKFNYLASQSRVHNIGVLWSVTLYEMYWNLVEEYGFSSNWFDANQTEGNIVAMKLVIGGMKFQPCNPTFLNARDAILTADETYYGGKNKCMIWKAFAKRGMGVNAKQSGYVEDETLPSGC